MKSKKIVVVFIILLVFISGAVVGQFLPNLITAKKSNIQRINITNVDNKQNDELGDLNIVKQIIEDEYYLKYDKEAVKAGMCKGMAEALKDPYSVYMTKNEYTNWLSDVSGELEGIGMSFVQERNGKYKIISTIEGSPAERAGIKAGDELISVNGKIEKDPDAMAIKIRGKEGTKVSIKIKRKNQVLNIDLKRKKLFIKSVYSSLIDKNIGYIKITMFEKKTEGEFKEAINKIKNKKINKIIIDLRDNGGGLLNSALNITDMLLGKAVMTTVKSKEGIVETYKSDASKLNMDYCILVNGFTASASELMSVAIKENMGGKIIGTKTFGKGIIQESRQLPSGAGIKLTVGEYLSPKGNVIHKKGVIPDIIIKQPNKQLEKAIKILKK